MYTSFLQQGTWHGVGVYFAVNASYSADQKYAKPDDKGNCRMYYAKVLTGEYTQGNDKMLTAPPINPSKPQLYDSTVNNVKSPTVFVTYHDDQAYPEYTVTFGKK